MKNKIFFGILIILIIAVAAFFIFRNKPAETLSGNVVSNPEEQILAQVNGMPITLKEAEKAQEYIKAQTGKLINQTEAIKRVISEKLILQGAEKHGFTQTLEDTEQEISKILATKNQTLTDFRNKIESKGQDYQTELENYRKQLLIEKYLSEAIAQPNVTDAQALTYYNQNKNKMFTGNATLSYEKISQQLKLALAQKQGQEAITAYLAKLYENATIVYTNQ
jgi:hypothetical protein